MLEFPEFLSIIKGGSGGASYGADDDGSGAIYQFFKDLTDDKMEIDGNSNIPFSLFITSMRRRKILQSMWAKDETVKKDGERILGNYKKQLAEKLAREAIENGEV
jgi:centrin-1